MVHGGFRYRSTHPTNSLFLKISKVVLLDVNEPFLQELEDFLEDFHNPRVLTNAVINGMSFKTGYIIVSPLN